MADLVVRMRAGRLRGPWSMLSMLWLLARPDSYASRLRDCGEEREGGCEVEGWGCGRVRRVTYQPVVVGCGLVAAVVVGACAGLVGESDPCLGLPGAKGVRGLEGPVVVDVRQGGGDAGGLDGGARVGGGGEEGVRGDGAAEEGREGRVPPGGGQGGRGAADWRGEGEGRGG